MPRWPYRLPRGSGGDGVVRTRGHVLERLLHVGRAPVRIRAWRTRDGHVHVRAESLDPTQVEHPIAIAGAPGPEETPPAGEAELGIALERMRFSLAVAAAGGAAAGVAVVAVARAARSPRRPPRRGLFRRREKVVASRSFLVDVHVLGR